MKVLALIIALAAIGVVAYLVVTMSKSSDIAVVETNDSLLTSDEAAILEPTVSPTAMSSASSQLLAGGSSYADPDGVFVFLYPNDYKLDKTEGRYEVRIYKTGATQRGQTEMYDGVILVFDRIDLEGKTLSEWVDASIKASTDNGTGELESPKKSITVNGYSGFAYTMRGLGTSEHKVIQKDANSDYAISIVQSVNDPENVGFQAEVDSILTTLEIMK